MENLTTPLRSNNSIVMGKTHALPFEIEGVFRNQLNNSPTAAINFGLLSTPPHVESNNTVTDVTIAPSDSMSFPLFDLRYQNALSN